MIYKRIKTTSDPLFKSCWEIYCSNFPLEERRDLLEQKRIFDIYCSHPNEQEHPFIFNALLKKCDPDVPAGIFAYWEFSEVIFGEHLAISQQIQGSGLGKIAISHLKTVAETRKKPILLEIEFPKDNLTKRRESFYKRLDFKINPYEHFQPCYHKGDEPVEMLIMTWPREVDEATYERFKQEQMAIMPVF